MNWISWSAYHASIQTTEIPPAAIIALLPLFMDSAYSVFSIVVNSIAIFNQIKPDELWLAFGTGSNFHYIPIYEVVSGMDSRNCVVLPVFHAFTGCDTVSSFGGIGKKTAWINLASFS